MQAAMATSQVETVSTGADKAKLGLSVALVLAALAGFYLLSRQGALAQWAVLLVGLADPQGSDPDHCLRLRFRRGDGAVPLAD